ncbi:TAT-binding protein-like protein 7, AAA ATPase [Stygiomarasmius scandens]|uniref:TAT-binding protein-like protein 7, AAA ATPase n=1 Tax=Marasmiellus scandens TaxID=2682957 RepID=A0ABR1IW40_9AGAR
MNSPPLDTVPDSNQTFPNAQTSPTKLVIKLPSMAMDGRRHGLRRSSRRSNASLPSGSEYNESDRSIQDEDEKMEDEEEEEEKPVIVQSSRGRRLVQKSYVESDLDAEGDDDDEQPAPAAADLFAESVQPRSGRRLTRRSTQVHDGDEEEDDDPQLQRATRSRTRTRDLPDFVVDDEEDHGHDSDEHELGIRSRLRRRKSPPRATTNGRPKLSNAEARAVRAQRRENSRKAKEEADIYIDDPSSAHSADGDASFDEAPNATSDLDLEIEPPPPRSPEEEPDNNDKPYSFRQRQKINYAIPPPLEDLPRPPSPKNKRIGGGRNNWNKRKGLGWSASGAELGKWMGLPGDDSDSDVPTRTPRKQPFGGLGGVFGGGVAGGGGGLLPGDLAAAGTPSNLGKVSDHSLADADPLGVNVNVTFDEVGGLDEHINSLKEMTLLPLLYPEVFQQFGVTPPRGVLFHGPPGTGKTLLARALAASCRSGGKQITFFMRKGADALSKWVGEAERQLRLLFEEARASQPSIIFFDEIDGLAPVRSSKQDQIHASIVSTLLALMDGMDGRGQVVVIGATNRPDAIDPALRRPGRFDREFYFPLPSLEAREKILTIMTKKWEGWQDEAGKERISGLAKLTKGYGGADLRALCTEAALNAVQRKYPQIYKSNDRLLLQPDSISVGLRDFMISIKRLVPSSARSSSSAATPLPAQFVPLLSETVEKIKEMIARVLPLEKKLTALEEAEFEDYDGEEGALEREMTLQSMETLRVHRPRLILHGPVGMGQGYVGAALLHHLEGYHIQSLELGTLLSDSTRTVEAAIVQLFVEAKRHQPSVIYIPSLVGWCAAVSETSRSTVRAMLDTLSPTDPILLLAIVDGGFSQLPRDVRAWFGPTKDNRVELKAPDPSQRGAFFNGLIEDIRRPPNQFADGMKRRKRVLEELPLAPPPEPRQPTVAEMAIQVENDQKTITLLKYRLGPILTELKRKFKRFTKRATEEYDFSIQIMPPQPQVVETLTNTIEVQMNGTIEIMEQVQQQEQLPLVNGNIDPTQQASTSTAPAPVPAPPAPEPEPQPKLYDMDLERIHTELYRGRYLTSDDFLADVQKIVHNAEIRAYEDLDRYHKAQAMLTATEVSLNEFDPAFRMECERMAVRERKRREEYKKKREKEKAEKAKEKGKEKEGSADTMMNGNGTRRSARNNGLQPELTITDPVQLERRLKRQREGGSANGSRGGSVSNMDEDENGQGRDIKRSRLLDQGTDNYDELNISTPPRPHNVRFAMSNDPFAFPSHSMQQPMGPMQQQPFSMGMGMGGPGPSQGGFYPHEHVPMNPGYQGYSGAISPGPGPGPGYHQPSFGPQPQNHMPSFGPMAPFPMMSPMPHTPQRSAPHSRPGSVPFMQSPSGQFGPMHGHDHSQGPGSGPGPDFFAPSLPPVMPNMDSMMVDAPAPSRPSGGFDPALLNPVPTPNPEPSSSQQTPGPSTSNKMSDINSIMNHSADDTFLNAPVQQEARHSPVPQSIDLPRHSRSPAPAPVSVEAEAAGEPSAQNSNSTPVPEPEAEKPPSPIIVIERTPTPLPDFHINDFLVERLKDSLRDDTSSLTIEQLEQLRATCLGCVWRNRREWDRDACVKEVQEIVKEFLREVGVGDDESDMET